MGCLTPSCCWKEMGSDKTMHFLITGFTCVRGGFKVKQTAKKRGKQYREQSPEEMGSGRTKRVKMAASKTAEWQPLSESSREILNTMMDSVILSILSQELTEKEDIQKHLNLLKERLQRHFKNLKVPSGKLGNLKNVVNLKVLEKQKLTSNEKSVALLQEEIEKAVQAAEHTDENIRSLQDKIRMLRSELEEEENKAESVFQRSGRGVLNLPELPTNSLEAPVLQEEILKIPNQTGVLKNLNTVQHSAEMRNMLSLLKQAYEKVDSL
ncbi:PREDICTED: centromere protein Q isoform X5 [Gavialis gangeticus]|uniref:centromere protein Q isoform X5 n=1 Tax=Gavialis gangeticus TaxID=94835 RepID=UPI00092E518C|nr:PREDICTED: centromere protein Q isoform X5 [Gavialis gangeticus]